MAKKSVAVFIDYENIRRGLWRHFQQRVPEDIPISRLLGAIKEVSDAIGSLYEGQVFGDWTLRSNDAREIENVQHFRATLVLRSDSKKDRTDPVMNFAIDDFFRDKPTIDNIILCAGDADYCEVMRRGNRMHKNIYVCAVGPQTAPELLSLAKAFYPIEQRLGLKHADAEELRDALAKLDPAELDKWTPLIRQLDKVESRLPYVVRSHFIKQYIAPGLGYGDEFEQKAEILNLAEQIGLLEFDRVPHPQSGLPVRIVRLNRSHEMVKTILAQEPH
jgi:hypothetical protein